MTQNARGKSWLALSPHPGLIMGPQISPAVRDLENIFGNRILFAPVELDKNDKPLGVDSSAQMIAVDIKSQFSPASPPKNIQLQKLATLYWTTATSRNLYANCADDIPKMFEAAGFVDVRSESQMQYTGKWSGENGVAMRSTVSSEASRRHWQSCRPAAMALFSQKRSMTRLRREWDEETFGLTQSDV
ncbi:hypothetical protein GGX14DRAFT_592741 [Mycena pura]|uniref:Uncharacterized protein n=1 Tax=Mycena pura TaxID=153505 RepID=A0AAD6VTZ8_9AGAR|nr:hypothetical protein GGX14DRAFT_592741 [Mycena pura]